jgi:hypothetical protein
MKLTRRNPSQPQAGGGNDPAARRTREPGEGTNATRRRPDPAAEPIPDGEHKYVPRSPYRTGNY